MSQQVFELQAEPRTTAMGGAASRRMRRLENRIPAIIYGAGKEPTSITLDHNKVIKALENEAFYSHILTLNMGKQKEKVVLKQLQRHAYKPFVLHMDFLRINEKEKLRMHVPLHFTNEEKAVGVKIGGGVVSHHLTDIEISCLPSDLPEYIEVDMTALELGQALHLADLKLPKGVEIVALSHGHTEQHNAAVVSIHAPRKAVEEESTAAPVAAETEITSEKKTEEK